MKKIESVQFSVLWVDIYERSTHKRPGFDSAVGEEPFSAAFLVPSLVGVLCPAPLARTRHGQEGPGSQGLRLVSSFGVVS